MGTYKRAQREKYGTVTVNGKPAYPIGDKTHARLALSQLDRGGLSPAQKSEVHAKADTMLGKRPTRAKKAKKGGLS
jgi:hypothetical protein